MSEFTTAIDRLEEPVISAEVSFKHQAIRERYEVKKLVVEEWDEVEEECLRYFKYHMVEDCDGRLELKDEWNENFSTMAMAHVARALQCRHAGPIMAIAKSTAHGGIVTLVDFIARGIQEQRERGYISWVVEEGVVTKYPFQDHEWPGKPWLLTLEENRQAQVNVQKRWPFFKEYLDRFSKWIPPLERGPSMPELMILNPPHWIIKMHMAALSTIRRQR